MRPLVAATLLSTLVAAAPQGQPAESEEAAIERIFYPAFQLHMTLLGPLDHHAITRNAFASLGKERACGVYREAWRRAFDRHLPAWKQLYQTVVRSVVPPEALHTQPRRFMDPAVTDVYSDRVIAALKASNSLAIVRTMGVEILTELHEAAEAGSGGSPQAAIDPDAPGGLAIKCGVSLNYLERKPSVLDP